MNCPVCSQFTHLRYQDLTDSLYHVEGRWSYRQCQSCHHLFQDPLPQNTEAFYVRYHTHVATTPPKRSVKARLISYVLGVRLGFPTCNRIWKKVCGYLATPFLVASAKRKVLNIRFQQGGTIADLGCGNGDWLVHMKSLGWNVAGVEPDPLAASVARSRLGDSIQNTPIHEARFPSSSLDGVVLNHVIEHTTNPILILDLIRNWLKPDGVLVIATPNVSSRGHRLFQSHWRGLEPPRHLHLFSPRSLRHIVQAAGFHSSSLTCPTQHARTYFLKSLQLSQQGRVEGDRLGSTSWRLKLRARWFQILESLTWRFRNDGEEILLSARR